MTDFIAPAAAERRLFVALDALAGNGPDLVDLDRLHPDADDLGRALAEPAQTAFTQIHRSLVEELLAGDGMTTAELIRHLKGIIAVLALHEDRTTQEAR